MTNPLADPYFILNKVYGGGAFLKQAIAETPIEEHNRARTVKIVYGVMENDIYLEHCIRAFAPKNPKLPVRIVLKISVYMLLFLGKKKYMVTDNAVSLVKKLGKGGAAGFVNAFLRAFDADKIELPAGELAALSVRTSCPQFALSRLIKAYGKETAEKVAAFRAEGVSVRFCCDEEKLKACLSGAEYQKTPFADTYIFRNFARDEGYDEGEYTFQSVGSVAIAAGVEPCENVLDACAAPGGKSVLLSEKCAKVTSFELHPHRAALIESYAKRMHRENITVVCRDSSVYDGAYAEKFDAVLVDAPCTGYGVVSENPDIKFFRKEEDIAALAKAQRAILAACAGYVKKGGHLYYSTCSVFDEENDAVVGAFLAENPGFSPEAADSPLGHVETKYGLQFLPHISLGAGFYFCKMKRKA